MTDRAQKVLDRFPKLRVLADFYNLPDDILEHFVDCGYLVGEHEAIEMSRAIVQSVGEPQQ